jgi:tRNA A37 threonylcarbamoyladenosine synthetase subunit TsaC/SUA5/YrdC
MLPIPADMIVRIPASPIMLNLKMAFDPPVAPSSELDALIDLIDLIP